jgi:predicted amidohydrolase
VKLGLVQIKGNCLEKANFKKLLRIIRKTAQSGTQIIALPELFLHDYFCLTENREHFSLAHSLESKVS